MPLREIIYPETVDSQVMPKFLPALRRSLSLERWRALLWDRRFSELKKVTEGSSSSPSQHAVEHLNQRLIIGLEGSPSRVDEYLKWAREQWAAKQMRQVVEQILALPNPDAQRLIAVAAYLYAEKRHTQGDRALAEAKELDPSLLSIYELEASNQRVRGNLPREVQALEQCVLLTEGEPGELLWQMRLGEALVRQERFTEAWLYLSHFCELPAKDNRALSAAYCARQIGDHASVDRAYAHAAPSDSAPFDLYSAARRQLATYHRVAEVNLLLEGLDIATAQTRLIELAATAALHSGDVDGAVEKLAAVAGREDCAGWVPGTYAQFLELLERLDEALETYLRLDNAHQTPFLRFRAGVLLAQQERTQRAVEHYLVGVETRENKSLRADPERETDPQLAGLLDDLAAADGNENRIRLLEQIVPRASQTSLHRGSALCLAELLAGKGEWSRAWNYIRQSRGVRLPTIPLAPRSGSKLKFSLDMQYDEFTETEPLEPRTVLYESSLGTTTSCSPLAVCRELLSHSSYGDLLHVWSIEPGTTIHPSLLNRPNVVFVRKGSLGHRRYLAVSKYIVNNSTVDSYFRKRDGQHYLNTWHGVPWKKMGRDNQSEPFAYGNIARNFLHADAVLCPDPHTRDVLSRGMDVDELVPSTFVDGGYPRNDLSVNLPDEERQLIRKELGIRPKGHLVLYMPTWKGVMNERKAEVEKVVETVSRMSGPGYVVALRAHHYVSDSFKDRGLPEGFVVVPEHFDTNELIGAADVLVTDFSSVLFDAAAVGVPVVKLMADFESYRSERGLYFAPDDVPGLDASAPEEVPDLVRYAIEQPEQYLAEYREVTARFCAEEKGTSSQRAIELLFGQDSSESTIEAEHNRSRRSLLFSTGGLGSTGITHAARSLLTALEGSEYTPYLFPTKTIFDGATEVTRADIRAHARLLPTVGEASGTRMEREVLRYYEGRRYVDHPLFRKHLATGRKREAARRFGRVAFNAVVEYSGYHSDNIALMGLGANVAAGGRRGIILHNEMAKEVKNKSPHLASGMQILDSFDFIASVSEGVREYNASTLFEHYGIPRELHVTAENTINAAEIRKLGQATLDRKDAAWYGSDGAHAVVVARLSPEKNHRELFEAFAACRENLAQRVTITCLGGGPLRIELEQLIAELGIDDTVRLSGLVPNPYSHLRAADAMILPSLNEGQPVVILEALTLGTPVVATETPGSRSVLQNGEYGTLVPISREGIIEALEQVAEGRLRPAEHFDSDAFTQRSLEMFLEAIAPSPRLS